MDEKWGASAGPEDENLFHDSLPVGMQEQRNRSGAGRREASVRAPEHNARWHHAPCLAP